MHNIFHLFVLDNLGPEKQNSNGTKYLNNTNNETIEDLSALEQYLKDYDNKNSFSFTGYLIFLLKINLNIINFHF